MRFSIHLSLSLSLSLSIYIYLSLRLREGSVHQRREERVERFSVFDVCRIFKQVKGVFLGTALPLPSPLRNLSCEGKGQKGGWKYKNRRQRLRWVSE
jgi:hypothetical protein